ncbi:uncharacterized protein LOC119584966 [Penaeus monodon]|uniref:uncharacterized protein LOC119584966 n=1 Tax=Penaeus monodon TaxID=6687 RepID=UPI0018A737E9|nr:uncharacterized protein LOC119584966 [Penaeus monodon]
MHPPGVPYPPAALSPAAEIRFAKRERKIRLAFVTHQARQVVTMKKEEKVSERWTLSDIVLRDNNQGITIRHLARRGVAKRVPGLTYEESRGVLKVSLENVIRDAVTYTEHAKRKTVTSFKDLKMLWEPSGCCCFTLRTGSLVMASLVIFFGTCSMLYVTGYLATQDLDSSFHEICKEEEDIQDCITTIKNASYGIIGTRFMLDFIQVTFSILLIHGVLKNKTRFLVPYMIMVLVGICILMLTALAMMGILIYEGIWRGVFIVAIIFGVIIFLETYFLLVVRALYLQLKRSKGQAHVILTEDSSSENIKA